ncbi:phytanoyl-CoA hydroxylase-interacting protein-like [Ditylenchus destructor]|nr:phytanoyl-CoA hydroxylase-interacting protein-like [Ditylenchus destructor]
MWGGYCWDEYANRDTQYGPAKTSSAYESENAWSAKQYGSTYAAWPYDPSGPPKHVPITQVLSTNQLPTWATRNRPSDCSKPALNKKLRSLFAPIPLPQLSQASQAPMCTRFGSCGMPAIDVSGQFKYKQFIEVDNNLSVVDRKELAPHITSHRFKTTPGQKYNVKLIIVDQEEKRVATGKGECKAVFSLEEINKLMDKALILVATTPMQPFTFLYRCKPRIYWDHIRDFRNGKVEKYIKDNGGHSASPINGQIYGLFFFARTMADGSLPLTSPFGDIRIRLKAPILLDPNRVNMYFCDFYCFCHDWLKQLDMENNPFLRVQRTGDLRNPFTFLVNRAKVWVEIYYTEDISMTWGAFDAVTPTGISNNQSCLKCNLYPSGPQPDIQKHNEPVEDLIVSNENALSSKGSDETLKKCSTCCVLHSCIESELHSPSTPLNATISKEDFLELFEVITQIVDNVVKAQELISEPQENLDSNSADVL